MVLDTVMTKERMGFMTFKNYVYMYTIHTSDLILKH